MKQILGSDEDDASSGGNNRKIPKVFVIRSSLQASPVNKQHFLRNVFSLDERYNVNTMHMEDESYCISKSGGFTHQRQELHGEEAETVLSHDRGQVSGLGGSDTQERRICKSGFYIQPGYLRRRNTFGCPQKRKTIGGAVNTKRRKQPLRMTKKDPVSYHRNLQKNEKVLHTSKTMPDIYGKTDRAAILPLTAWENTISLAVPSKRGLVEALQNDDLSLVLKQPQTPTTAPSMTTCRPPSRFVRQTSIDETDDTATELLGHKQDSAPHNLTKQQELFREDESLDIKDFMRNKMFLSVDETKIFSEISDDNLLCHLAGGAESVDDEDDEDVLASTFEKDVYSRCSISKFVLPELWSERHPEDKILAKRYSHLQSKTTMSVSFSALDNDQKGVCFNEDVQPCESKLQSCDTEDRMCRICLDGDTEEPLIRPCFCCGTTAWVHRNCLEEWLTMSNTFECELCQYIYATRLELKPICKVIGCQLPAYKSELNSEKY